jgi:2-methylcitrate dehydratase PrpD
MKATQPCTEILSDFISNLSYRDLPQGVVRLAKYHTLDLIGDAIAASNMSPVRMIARARVVRNYSG